MVHAQEQERKDVAEKRKDWVEQQGEFDSSKCVFLDESGVNIDLTRRYGRAKGAARVHDKVPLNTPKNTTILSSVRLDGETVYTHFQGSLTGDRFLAYVKEQLVPHLREGDIVIMDNLRSHKVSGVREAIEEAKAFVLYLPPYSPDFNPIEMLWSKLKAFLRKEKARSLPDLDTAIPRAFDSISTSDIAGWFQAAGYSLS